MSNAAMKTLLRVTALLSLLLMAAAALLAWDAHRLLHAPLAIEEVERVTIARGLHARPARDS